MAGRRRLGAMARTRQNGEDSAVSFWTVNHWRLCPLLLLQVRRFDALLFATCDYWRWLVVLLALFACRQLSRVLLLHYEIVAICEP